jgi:hypothetical protein
MHPTSGLLAIKDSADHGITQLALHARRVTKARDLTHNRHRTPESRFLLTWTRCPGLMARLAARVSDKRVLKLVRAFLNAGVMEDGLVSPVDEGTPQGGPLSPILSNLVLDDLDKELARWGHRSCRYADDCNIYVRSRRAGERVMASVSRFLANKLRLKVNEPKSAVARPEERKFLRFSISNDGSQRRIAKSRGGSET